jgi:hypothetical protein
MPTVVRLYLKYCTSTLCDPGPGNAAHVSRVDKSFPNLAPHILILATSHERCLINLL